LGKPDFKNWSYFEDLPEAQDKSLWLKGLTPLGLEAAVPTLDDTGLDFISRCLQYIPEQRISAAEALEHPFFESVRDKYAPMYRSINRA
jgi:serine/threonine protein kinase